MYSYENYNSVKQEIERRRTQARAEADRRSALMRELSPEIAKIDEELAGTGLLIFKTACSGGDIAPIRKRNQELCRRRREIIKSLGYSEDYTDVHYTCTECSDTGFVDGAKMCKCFREQLVRATIVSSGIGNLIEKQSFENFSLEYYKSSPDEYKRMSANLESAKKYAKDFGKAGGNLILMGGTGTGKTHISTAIAKEVISAGYDVIYDSIQNIISDFEYDRFRAGYAQSVPKSEKYTECDLLIIDDLGTEFSNQFSVSCLYNLINTRQNKGLSTIISTNLSPVELTGTYDGRICSRIFGCYQILQFVGSDRRIG